MATDIPNFVLYASMGLVFALVYYKTGRLEVSITVHFFNNAMGAIAMILMKEFWAAVGCLFWFFCGG